MTSGVCKIIDYPTRPYGDLSIPFEDPTISILSQFRTFFWPGEMLRQRPDASAAVSGYIIGAILADWWLVFQREIQEIHFL